MIKRQLLIRLCMDKEALPAFVRVLAEKNEAEEHVILTRLLHFWRTEHKTS